MPSNEDHGCCFISFASRFFYLSFDGSFKTLCSTVELYILDPFELVFVEDSKAVKLSLLRFVVSIMEKEISIEQKVEHSVFYFTCLV